MAEIEEAEKKEGTAKVAKDAKKEGEKGKEIDKAELERREGEAKKRQEAEAAFAKAMEPVETLVAAWDFPAAAELLPKVSIPSGGYAEDFARRLSTRRDELARLAALKAKFIAKVNGKKPPYRKGSLFIPGANADLTKADDQGITAVPPDGKPELVPWPSLSSRSVQALILQSVDRQSADDWLAAGILLLALKDASAAEKHFDKAKELGAAVERYLDPLAAGAFAQAQALLEAKKPAEAGSALAALEKKYAATPWLAAHKADLASARDGAKSGIAESEAEKLYADAAKLFEKKELFDLKPLIEKLKTDYPKTRPVTDAQGKPSFAEMLRATEDLGRFITVRQDGKADFKTIQGALSAAPSNSVIEIQDKGPYNEHLVFPARQGLTLRGKKGLWPLIISAGENRNFVSLVEAKARDAALGRLVIAAYQAVPDGGAVSGGSLRSVILVSAGRATYSGSGADVQDSFLTNSSLVGRVKNTIFAGGGWPVGAVELENCVISGGLGDPGNSTKLRSCIVGGGLQVSGGSDLADSILCGGVSTPEPNTRIEYCDVMGTLVNFAKPGKHCFSADPQFRDPANFDYRLKPTSPCRKKASDGGDLGVRYTPEMVEVLEKALELRKKGIIKF